MTVGAFFAGTMIVALILILIRAIVSWNIVKHDFEWSDEDDQE